MRVLMTADTVGGVWTYALELMRVLQPHGFQFILATMGKRLSLAQTHELSRLPHVVVRESEYRLEWMEEPWEDVARSGEWLLKLEQAFSPDVVHLNGFAHAALPWRAPTVVAAHSCVFSWWRAVKGEGPPPAWERYGRAVREGLRAASVIVTPTEAMQNALDTHYGPLPRPVKVIFNGRAARDFHTSPKEPFVLAAGRLWDEAKNIAALCAVAPRLPFPVYVAGNSGESGNQAYEAAGIRPLGFLAPPALADWLARAAVYALPARYEPFGLSILEAALSGCALVLGDIPSLREVWGDAAQYVPPDDTDGLETTLRHLIDNHQERQRWATAAAQRAGHYTPERMARAYRELYTTLQANRANARLAQT